MSQLPKAILRTLAYTDVFDYHLKENEIWRFLISNLQLPASLDSFGMPIYNLQKELHGLSAKVSKREGFYFLKGREELVELREGREKLSQKKLKIAQRVAQVLKVIPFIKMVAVTGNLAMGNADLKDDIDLLIVTAKDRLWLTRLLTVCLVELVANRRRPQDREVQDKICLNMFLEEGYLQIPQNEQNLFTAHEVCQLKPLWDRDKTYLKFLQANLWVGKFLPNGVETRISKDDEAKRKKQKSPKIFEQLARQLQLKYMKSHRTTEVIQPGRLLFHPHNHQSKIMVEYQKRLKKLGLYD